MTVSGAIPPVGETLRVSVIAGSDGASAATAAGSWGEVTVRVSTVLVAEPSAVAP